MAVYRSRNGEYYVNIHIKPSTANGPKAAFIYAGNKARILSLSYRAIALVMAVLAACVVYVGYLDKMSQFSGNTFEYLVTALLIPVVLFTIVTIALGKVGIVDFGSATIEKGLSKACYLSYLLFGYSMTVVMFREANRSLILLGVGAGFCGFAVWATARYAQMLRLAE